MKKSVPLFWDSQDLANPGSRNWKKRFKNWVEATYPDLGVYDVVGRKPRPICFVFPLDFTTLVQEMRCGRGDKSRGERWALCCSKAKFAVFVGSGSPGLTWQVVSGKAGQGEIAFGFYIENGYQQLPPDKTTSPFHDEGIDQRLFLRRPEWDWNRFRRSVLDSPDGRRLISDIMRSWDRPLILRLSPADPNDASSTRRYWFDRDQLWLKQDGLSEAAVGTNENEMWDWICHRADNRTAWLDVMLLEFTNHARGEVDPGSAERVSLLLVGLLPLLRRCWSTG